MSARLTVAIPSRDRLDSLGETLMSLGETHPHAPLDVLVIDDGSSPPYPADLGIRLPATDWSIRLIRGGGDGLNAGRNRAMQEADTDWVAFLDDDVYVVPGWADALLRAQEREDICGVAGRIRIQYEAPVPGWLDMRTFGGYLSELDFGDEQIAGQILPFGANFAVTSQAWRDAGGFFHGADRIGSSLVSGGETEFFRTVVQAGGAVLYEPAAEVRHRFSADRLSYDYFARRAFGQGVTDAIIDGGDGRILSELATVATGVRLTAIAEINRATGRRTAVRDRIWRQYARGRLTGALRQRETRRALAAQRGRAMRGPSTTNAL
jgi:GT2 family glycosyltransferase